jgi:hypothetical protein
LALIAGELQRQLGLKLEGDLTEIVRELKSVCAVKRCLLILDKAEVRRAGYLLLHHFDLTISVGDIGED